MLTNGLVYNLYGLETESHTYTNLLNCDESSLVCHGIVSRGVVLDVCIVFIDPAH